MGERTTTRFSEDFLFLLVYGSAVRLRAHPKTATDHRLVQRETNDFSRPIVLLAQECALF